MSHGNRTMHPDHSRLIMLRLAKRARSFAQLFPLCALESLTNTCSLVLRNIKNFYLCPPKLHSPRRAS